LEPPARLTGPPPPPMTPVGRVSTRHPRMFRKAAGQDPPYESWPGFQCIGPFENRPASAANDTRRAGLAPPSPDASQSGGSRPALRELAGFACIGLFENRSAPAANDTRRAGLDPPSPDVSQKRRVKTRPTRTGR